jgi:cellobiose-specific phosphotransferase system component IIA
MKPSSKHLSIINSRLPEHKVKADDVEILPFMVFDNKCTDRFTIMSPEMMAKVAQDLNDGKAAFNKLHESRYSLPVGHSVTARVVDKEDGERQVQALMYAVVKRPDGTVFEEGKDLADRYKMGAVRSCSAGVIVGFYKCNICGNDIRDYANCEHIPGRDYTIDEVPKKCLALMTGHKVQNGVAEDCGIYEVSAVTAGGVAAASAMTEAFGRYEDGTDPKEFKKTVIDDKGIDTRLHFAAAAPNPEEFDSSDSSEEENKMEKADVKAMLDEHYQPLKAEIDSLKKTNEDLQSQYDSQAGELTTAKEKITELEGQIEAKDGEFAKAQEDLTAANEKATEAESFKAEYVGIVVAMGTKAGEECNAEEFASKSLEDLKVLLADYTAKVEALPTGQQSEEESDEVAAHLDDAVYATTR